MPIISEAASAFRSRFGFHKPSSDSEIVRSSPAIPKSSSKENLFRSNSSLSSSSLLNLDSESNEIVPRSLNQSFELEDDPSFWKDHNVQVIIRIRPLSNYEISVQGNNKCVRQDSSQTITWIGHPESRFTFDQVADENVTQEKLFQVAGLPMVENCMGGYNSCMFAYGQTGSGKTHTMLGDIEGGTRRHSVNCGMTPRVFEHLFSRIQKEKESRRDEKLKFTCKCSFLEIYNEQILDLLDPSSLNLQIREDAKKGVYVENLKELEVTNARDVMQQLIQGSANRKVAATNMNRASSRSHSVFTCIIESKWEAQGVTHHRFARLNLVDLAGSERQKSSGAEGERLKEATNINKSLSTLGLVIMNLVSLSNGKSLHVPYRDSKLTFLLQDSLGGNSKTTIIANISPSCCCSLETLSTLKFAQRAKFIKNNAIVNEDASGDVLTMRIQIQQLKKEVSRLRGLVDGGIVNKEIDNGSICFPGSPGSFKWEGLQGSFTPLTSDTRISQRKEYEAALVGAFRRERDKELALQALAAENQATMHLAKKREDEIQGLKMRLRFREAGIKRLEAVASGKISAETHLLQEKEEYLKEIEALRSQVDRNQEVTRFALENLQLKEEIRRLKSFYEEGERERMSEQVTILENKLLEALDWKLMHESDPENAQNDSSDLAALEDSLISSSKEPRSWRSSIKEENEFLRMQAIQNQSEMETLRRKLKSYESETEEKDKLERRIKGLEAQLEEEKTTARNIQEAMQQLQVNLPCTTSTEDHSSDVTSNAHELKTMVDAIASASQREAEAHEIAINLGKENDELRAKIKASIEDNQKLIELYQVAAAEVCKAREIHSNSGLAEQLQDMQEENEKLMGLYEKAMQERDEYKRRIFSCEQNTSKVKEEINCPEKFVEVDGGKDFKFEELFSKADDAKLLAETGVTGLIELEESDRYTEDPFIDEKGQTEAHADVVGNDESSTSETRPCKLTGVEVLEELVVARNKLENVPDKLANVAKALKSFGSLEKLFIMVDRLARDIEVVEEGILAKKQEIADIKHFSSQKQNQKRIVQNKLSALKSSTSKISYSFFYWEQREARARARVDSSHTYVNKKEEALAHLQARKEETETAILKAEESELSLRDHLICLTSKLEKESQRKESDNVLVTIDNLDKTNIPALRTWHCDVKATDLLKAEEEKTKLKSELKQYKEKLSFVLKEIEDLKRRSKALDSEIQVTEGDIVTGLQSAMDMELAYKNVIKEKETLQEMSENGRNDIQEMIIEYHQCVFECDLKDSEMKLLEEELPTQSQSLKDLRASMVAATQNRTQLLDDAKCFFMLTEENNQAWYVSEKVEELLREVQISVLEAKSLLDIDP
ncbi:hypothetical protein AQUCO_00400565v1 [Aquilegia coerulea]|uniref:Kinesin motor domain-containing protein n=1 Tax=Aquilegia coerulea TaxID=218851 RepID=A0A2G5EVJ1_AQUCA|nr:hypothetical protein AQUCO_00400565v1 [Aquilegia coerulea]